MSYAELTPPSEGTPTVATRVDRTVEQQSDEWVTDFQDPINLNVGRDFPAVVTRFGRSGPDQSIPPDLDQMIPGAVMGVVLAGIDTRELSGHDRVVVLRAHQRLASYYQAHVYTDMTAVTDWFENSDDGEGPADAANDAAVEIAAALRLTRRAADNELFLALNLRHRLPVVHDMLMSGLIDLRRARCIESATLHLPILTARDVVDRIAEAAPNLTAGQLRARIQKLCIEADPDDARRRHDRAVTDRRFVMEPNLAGTCDLLGLDLPAGPATAAARRINRIARSLRRDGETRTMDQLRADVFLDLLAGTDHATNGGRAVVHITADLDMLAALSDHPGDLAGYGPVIADIARQVAAKQSDTGTEWRWTVTDAVTGEVTYTGITSRRPTAAMRRNVEAHDRTCIFPGCRMPAVDSDLDHRLAVADGGPTTEHNLAPLCRYHHIAKHRGWHVERLHNGEYRWTSPTGHTYTTRRAPP